MFKNLSMKKLKVLALGLGLMFIGTIGEYLLADNEYEDRVSEVEQKMAALEAKMAASEEEKES